MNCILNRVSGLLLAISGIFKLIASELIVHAMKYTVCKIFLIFGVTTISGTSYYVFHFTTFDHGLVISTGS